MHKYDLHDKVHYPKADNAIANDRAIAYHRLRCGARVINLVAKAMIYGTNIDALTDAHEMRPHRFWNSSWSWALAAAFDLISQAIYSARGMSCP
jgi:hypothetical protein